jgi:uncharacterized protein (TIGR02172 family)
MDIEIKNQDGLGYVALKGSISSANAQEFEKAIENLPGEGMGIILDAMQLNYISSAGLRVILAAKKRCKGKTFQIINVSQSVMKIFEVTGFTQIMDIQAGLRHIEISGCSKIGAGACGECYRLDDETIIKLYYSKITKEEIEKEKELSKKAFVMGVPTAISYDIVESEGRVGVIYELLNCKTLAEILREDTSEIEKYVKMYADVCRQIHSIDGKDASLPSFKEINRKDIGNITGITDEERNYLHRFLDLLPDSTHCVHGDLNPNNIMIQNGECCLIDMGEFSTGNPLFDVSRIVFSMRYAGEKGSDFNYFYKLPTKVVSHILELFLKFYFECDSMDEAIQKDSNAQWLEPLAWFRCATSMLKGDNWGPVKREEAMEILHNRLIPFIQSKDGK